MTVNRSAEVCDFAELQEAMELQQPYLSMMFCYLPLRTVLWEKHTCLKIDPQQEAFIISRSSDPMNPSRWGINTQGPLPGG
jgi:hypothetical protein